MLLQAKEKRIVNCKTVDVNQLMPMKYHWAWEHYLNGCHNNWMPEEIPMNRDIAEWKSDVLSEEERLVVLRNLGFFSTAESLVGNNIVLAIFKHVTNPEARQYLLRQAFEEAIHTHAFHYIVDSLSLDSHVVFNMYNEVNTIHNKDAFEMALTEEILKSDFSTENDAGLTTFLKNLIGYYIIMEGIFFYSGFAMILSFQRKNLLTGIGEQFQYILRDETIHLNFGIDLINTIKEENPSIWTSALQEEIKEMVDKATWLEYMYAKECLPKGVLGLSAPQFFDYVRHISDRRLERIGINPLYGVQNPFPWMSECIDLEKEKNFFETKVTQYRSGASLAW